MFFDATPDVEIKNSTFLSNVAQAGAVEPGAGGAIVYYFEKPVHFIYKLNIFNKIVQTKEKGKCVIVSKPDLVYIENNKNFTILRIIEPLYLYGSLDRIK